MNSKCPVCSHRFRFGERKRFVTWHFSRRAAACPDCHTILVWERTPFVRFVTGMLLVSVFDGIALGVSLFQFLSGKSWEALPAAFRFIQIGSLLVAGGALAVMLLGVLRFHLLDIREAAKREARTCAMLTPCK